MKLRLASIALLVALASAFALMPFGNTAAARPATPLAVEVPITGSFTDASGGVGKFVGALELQRFTNQNGQLAAIGLLTGTLTDAAGNTVGTVNQTATFPVSIQATCKILHLELGPLDLNLLGLKVHLDKVVLDITAEQGPGNLLGNLLCAIARLLDGNNVPLDLIVRLLNRVLAIIG